MSQILLNLDILNYPFLEKLNSNLNEGKSFKFYIY